jgi:hypothetical protein
MVDFQDGNIKSCNLPLFLQRYIKDSKLSIALEAKNSLDKSIFRLTMPAALVTTILQSSFELIVTKKAGGHHMAVMPQRAYSPGMV